MQDALVDGLCKELKLRESAFLNSIPFKHVYFGGGTPSLLTEDNLRKLFGVIQQYGIAEDAEVTLEVNPDDVTLDFAQMLKQFPINRISMGVQSFIDDELVFLGRRHNVESVYQAVEMLRQNGFCEMSIDLIYGLPNQSFKQWETSLEKALALKVPHVSAYHLIYEPGTPLDKKRRRGEVVELEEEKSVAYFKLLIDKMKQHGYCHYEISNFAWSGHEAKLNRGYWMGEPYIGVGPSAHSYSAAPQFKRSYNIADLSVYLRGISEENLNVEEEFLSKKERYNEFLMTRLRMMDGLELVEIQKCFGVEYYSVFKQAIEPYVLRGLLTQRDGRLFLSEEGLFVSDGIISDLFLT